MSIQGPGILWRLRAGGTCLGLANVNATSPTYIQRNGILQTALANKLRLHWHDDNGDGVYEIPTYKIEPAATNILTWCRDCTDASWSKTNTSAAKTQTGVDGAANSASLITATAAGGTCLHGVVSASSIRSFTAYVKRISGVGSVQMTMDGGSTWTTINVTTQWTRYRIPTQTLVNPSCGFRVNVNSDQIAVDYCQLESTNYDTTPLLTTSGTTSRNADSASATFPYRPTAMTLYVKYVATTQNQGAPTQTLLQVGSSNPLVTLGLVSGQAIMQYQTGVTLVNSTAGSTASAAQLVEVRGVLNSDGSVLVGQSLGGASEVVGATSSPLALVPTWSTNTVVIGGAAMGLVTGLILSGVRSLDACRGLV